MSGDRDTYRVIADALEGVGRDSAEAIAVLRQKAKRTRVVVVAACVAVILSLGAGAVTIVNLNRVDNVATRTSDDVLCPLYDVFLASDTPATRERVRQEQGAEALKVRDQAFKVIRQGYNTLGCAK